MEDGQDEQKCGTILEHELKPDDIGETSQEAGSEGGTPLEAGQGPAVSLEVKTGVCQQKV